MNLVPPPYYLRRFPSTIQILKKSTGEEIHVAEVPVPYDAQTPEWWSNYLNKAIEDASKRQNKSMVC